nr:hypothetical protein Iba_chr04aCG20130 [Ipomoea batatas]
MRFLHQPYIFFFDSIDRPSPENTIYNYALSLICGLLSRFIFERSRVARALNRSPSSIRSRGASYFNQCSFLAGLIERVLLSPCSKLDIHLCYAHIGDDSGDIFLGRGLLCNLAR